jgi:hypothetical protein
MTTLADLRPGDIGFGPIKGGAGLLVNAGQLLLGEGFRVGALDIRHVFVVVRSDPRAIGIVEAMPSGARSNIVGPDRWTSDYAYVRLPEDYAGQADDAAAIARAMVGTPYSFASYAALALWRVGVKTPRLEAWIGRRKAGRSTIPGLSTHGFEIGPTRGLPCEAICSVLADQAWSLTGKKIMQGVAHQCVTPGALAGRLLTMTGTQWFWPGREGS